MDIQKSIDPSQFEIGVIVARFQVHKLHEAHISLIDKVCEHHKKVIIFLGCPVIENTQSNPLDFASRKIMIQEMYPDIIILPQKDQRYDAKWAKTLDEQIRIPFGDRTALLYGSRDSFIPHYTPYGKHPVVELTTDVFISGTEIRKEVSREILASSDFRAGIIHANYAKMVVTYPTVDIVAQNDEGKILLGKKLNESQYRFIGGFVDRTDTSWEYAAKREFMEETGGCEVGDLKYIASGQIADWRYYKNESGIMTTLFLGKFIFGSIKPSDDIASLHWVLPSDINIETEVMPEHKELFTILISYLKEKATQQRVNAVLSAAKNRQNTLTKTGIDMIVQERNEQLIKHGFTTESDKKYGNGEMSLLASYLIKEDNDAERDELREVLLNGDAGCAFDKAFIDKLDTKTKPEQIAIAGAFLAAEIDRIGK